MCECKNATNLGKLYPLHKIHKKLQNVPGCFPLNSFLTQLCKIDYLLSKIFVFFLCQIKTVTKIHENAIFVDVVGSVYRIKYTL